MPVINNANSLRAGIQNHLADTWRQKMASFDGVVTSIARMLPDVKIRNASWVWKESLPFFRKWEYGKGRSRQTFKDRTLPIAPIPFELTLPYSEFDERDDQLGDMKTHISGAVDRFKLMPVKLASEYLNGTAVLNDAIANAYDGVTLISATDGDGAARFGATGGNLLTSEGLTPAGIMKNHANAQRRFLNFLDPAGQPIFDEEMASFPNLTAIIPNALNEVFQKVSGQEFIHSDNSQITSDSNYLKGQFKYRINPFLTDDSDYFIVLEHPVLKPFAYRYPAGDSMRQYFADMTNSDHARETNESALYVDARSGIAPYAAYTIIKVNT